MIVDGADQAQIDTAAKRISQGELVAFATETVYGLGARADDDAAVGKIFEAKGRPSNHPLIVHVSGIAQAERFAADLPLSARRLMAAFWPGPMTVIVPRHEDQGCAAAGGQASIGLRCPAHPVAKALLAAAALLGVQGVAAPSANRFGRVSPTRASHVASEFDDTLLILDGGECALGIESSIVDCSRAVPTLLRPGVLLRSDIEAVLGEPLHAADADAPRASGTLESHYAPKAKVVLLQEAELQTRLNAALASGSHKMPAVYSRFGVIAHGVIARRMPTDPGLVAQELFAVLRELDATGVSEIWIEAAPTLAAWDGVRDRLQRASAS